MSEKNPFKIS